jgi:hypothetical protein
MRVTRQWVGVRTQMKEKQSMVACASFNGVQEERGGPRRKSIDVEKHVWTVTEEAVTGDDFLGSDLAKVLPSRLELYKGDSSALFLNALTLKIKASKASWTR